MKRRTPHVRVIHYVSAAALVLSAAVAGAAPAVADGQAGTTLDATASATTHLTKTYEWTLEKSVTPTTLDLFRGDSGTASYTVQATRDEGTVAASVSGEVCVTNGGAVATEGLAILATVYQPPNGAMVASGAVDVSGNPILEPGEQECYPYTIALDPYVAGGTYKVTAAVTITNHSGHLGDLFGPSPSATAVMASSPTVVHGSLDVTDTNGGSWIFDGTGSQTYDQTFTCADEGTNTNTVTSSYGDDGATGPSDDATVTVNCYELGVTKTADTSLTRTWSWTIDKSADQSALTLALNQLFDVNYSVSVAATSADSNWAATGTITVHNPAPMAATLNSVTDAVGAVGATVDCPVTFPYTLAAGGTLNCTYTVDLASADGATNIATATLQNSPSGTTDFTGQAAVDFTKATVNQVDETATVTDTYAGALGSVSYTDTFPKVFTYTRTVGPYTTPGSYSVDNTATVTAGDTGTTSEDSVSIPVTVPTAGCSLTIGYWKTHAGGVGNNADMVTALLPIWLGTPGGATSVQVTNAGQAITLLGYSGDAANGINKLYGQLLGAKLNIANGAGGSAVASVISSADTFLATHNSADWGSLTKAQKTQVNTWVTALDAYNNGFTGPGHCTL